MTDELIQLVERIATATARAALEISDHEEPVLRGLITAAIACANSNDEKPLPVHNLCAMFVEAAAAAYELDFLDVMSATVGIVTATLASEGDERAQSIESRAKSKEVQSIARTIPGRPRRILTVSRRRSRK